MHILDRSHSKYRVHISDDYVIDSSMARNSQSFLRSSKSGSSGEGTPSEKREKRHALKGMGIIMPLKGARERNQRF